jgi:hypothetical protein
MRDFRSVSPIRHKMANNLYRNICKSYGDKSDITPDLIAEADRVGLSGASISYLCCLIHQSPLLKSHLDMMVSKAIKAGDHR